jgi:hypothetical protein
MLLPGVLIPLMPVPTTVTLYCRIMRDVPTSVVQRSCWVV